MNGEERKLLNMRILEKEADKILSNAGMEDLATDEIKLKVVKREAAKQGRVVAFFKSESASFIKACTAAKVKPSMRQASKWLNKKGAAWKARFE